MAALAAALERHVGPEAATIRRAPFGLGDPREVEALLKDAGFREVRVQTLGETARFPSVDAFVDAQLAATPLSTLGAFSDDARLALVGGLQDALRQYVSHGALSMPMEANIALARA